MKKLIFLLSVLFESFLAFSLPGIVSSVPDFSGQYVYYRDFTFERESYIGILYYDDSTYALRYYAPALAEKKSLEPEKNIHILFTINPENQNFERTGERILSAITPDDTFLVNYVESFFDEMTKHRQDAGIIESKMQDYQDYAQFGGKVMLYFDPLIPIYNLEKIISVDKKPVLQIVTAGQLVSSEDKSFENFKGIAAKFKDTNHTFKKDKKAKAVVVSYKENENSVELKAKLDSSWNAAAENFYTLGNVAVFTVSQVTSPTEGNLEILNRRLVLGTETVYPNWQNQKIEKKKKGTLYTQISYHSEADSYTYDFKFVREIDSKTIGLYTLTVFAGAYTSDKKYFNSILASFE